MAKFSAIVEMTADEPEDVKAALEAVNGVFNVYSIDTLDEEDDLLLDDEDED